MAGDTINRRVGLLCQDGTHASIVSQRRFSSRKHTASRRVTVTRSPSRNKPRKQLQTVSASSSVSHLNLALRASPEGQPRGPLNAQPSLSSRVFLVNFRKKKKLQMLVEKKPTRYDFFWFIFAIFILVVDIIL